MLIFQQRHREELRGRVLDSGTVVLGRHGPSRGIRLGTGFGLAHIYCYVIALTARIGRNNGAIGDTDTGFGSLGPVEGRALRGGFRPRQCLPLVAISNSKSALTVYFVYHSVMQNH
jgi:hypothetical protein